MAKVSAKASKRKIDARAAHMLERKSKGLSHREVAKEFGVSKSTAHRKVSALRQGFTKQGSAF